MSDICVTEVMISEKKKILITGGAGFIGSHLVAGLLKRGDCEVWSLDNYSTGSEANHIAGAAYIRGDTKDIERLVAMKPDIVFHLGEYSRVEKSFDDMEKVWESNAAGTFSVLEFCRARRCGISRMWTISWPVLWRWGMRAKVMNTVWVMRQAIVFLMSRACLAHLSGCCRSAKATACPRL